MPSHSRRGFLGGSALTVAGLTGGLGSDRLLESLRRQEASGTDSPAALLGPVPSADAIDVEYRTIVVQRVDVDDAAELPHQARATTRLLDVDPTALSRVVSIVPGDHRRRLGVAAGEFDALVDDADATEVDDWLVADNGDVGVATVDGLTAYAGGRTAERRRETATTMAKAATGDADRFLDETAEAASTIEALGDFDTILFVPSPGETGFPPVGGERLRSLAAGFETHPAELEGTTNHEYHLFPTPDASMTDETVRTIVDEIDPGIITEADVSREDDRIRVAAVVEAPPSHDREASPDARVRSSFDRDTTTLTFEHAHGEAIPADELELWVDGERAPQQPADTFDAFAPGDTITADTGPLGTAVLRWFDEEANAHYVYASETVDREAFDLSHDFDANAVEITYRSQHAADPAKLTVIHRSDDGHRRIENPFGDALTDGDSITVESVEIGDTVTLELDVPTVPGVHREPVARLRVAPPRIHLHNHPEKGVVARYHDEEVRDPEEFRLLVDDEPADVQFADVTDTVSPGDAIQLGEFPIGSRLAVKWHAPEEPRVITEHVVVPRTRVAMEYDENDGTIHIEHREGEALAADRLELRVNRDPADVQPAEKLDEFGPGDAFTVAVPPLANVELVWTHPERDHHLGGTMTARDAIEARYDPDRETMKLTYVGSQPVDPERLRVRQRSASTHRGSSSSKAVFDETYEELTAGDSVEIDAPIGDRVDVAVRTETENSTSVRSFGHFSTEPRHAFSLREKDGAFSAIYRDPVNRDAEEFRVLVDGTPATTQPADVHETLERDATIDLGEFDAGTTITVEWTAPAEPREVNEHTIPPEATFEATYDADEATIEVSHAGGAAVDADDLSVVAPPAVPRPTDWDGDGVVSEGDTTTFDVSEAESPRMFLVLFRERDVLYREEMTSD